MSEEQIIKNLLAITEESIRLESLSNQELVKEALSAGLCDILIVDEMMTRLDPAWFNETPETAS